MNDVVFVSFHEEACESNFNRLLSLIPRAKRIHGIQGIQNSYFAAAELASTDAFFLVDGDNFVYETFRADFVDSFTSPSPVLFQSDNDLGLTSSHGAIKYLQKSLFGKWYHHRYLDFTSRLTGADVRYDDRVLSHHQLGTGRLRWRAIFREVAKCALRDQDRLRDWLRNNEALKIYDDSVLPFLREREPLEIFRDLNSQDVLDRLYEDCVLLDL